MDEKPHNIQQLIKEYNEQKLQIENLKPRLSAAILDRNEFQKQNEQLIHQVNDLNQKNDTLIEKSKEYKSNNINLARLNGQLSQTVNELSQEKNSLIQKYKEHKSNNVNLARLNGQLETKVSQVEENISELLQEKANINRLVDELKIKLEQNRHQLDESNKKNKELTNKIEEIIGEMKKIEKELDRVKEESTITNLKIEPNIYLKGMFESFDPVNATLKILLEGNEYFYPLSEYKSEYLPVSGSRVLIFKDTNSKKMIFGFDVSKMIPEGARIQATLKATMPLKNELRLTTKEYGYITVKVTDSFMQEIKLNQSDMFILKQTYVDGDYYFTLEDNGMIQYNASEILKLIRG